MQVTPVSRTLADILRSSFLRIPRFQRPYSWDKENLSDFWNDIVAISSPDYFMGSLVLYRDSKERNLFYIVDGQQRLTTITLALSVIRDKFDEINQSDLAAGIHKFIISVDVDNRRRFILEHDPSNPYFQQLPLRDPQAGLTAGRLGPKVNISRTDA